MLVIISDFTKKNSQPQSVRQERQHSIFRFKILIYVKYFIDFNTKRRISSAFAVLNL